MAGRGSLDTSVFNSLVKVLFFYFRGGVPFIWDFTFFVIFFL